MYFFQIKKKTSQNSLIFLIYKQRKKKLSDNSKRWTMSFEPSFVANISKRGLKGHNSYDPNADGVLLVLAQHAKTKIEVSTNLSQWHTQHHLVRNSKTTSCVDWRIKYKMICSAKTVGQCCLCMTCQTQIVLHRRNIPRWSWEWWIWLA